MRVCVRSYVRRREGAVRRKDEGGKCRATRVTGECEECAMMSVPGGSCRSIALQLAAFVCGESPHDPS